MVGINTVSVVKAGVIFIAAVAAKVEVIAVMVVKVVSVIATVAAKAEVTAVMVVSVTAAVADVARKERDVVGRERQNVANVQGDDERCIRHGNYDERRESVEGQKL